MRTISPLAQSDSFKRSLTWSAAAHIVLVLVFSIRSLIVSDEMSLLDSAIRVDIVGLPEKIKPNEKPSLEEAPPSPPPPAAEQKKENAPPEQITNNPLPNKKIEVDVSAIKIEKARDLQRNALKKLKAQQAIADLKNKAESDKKAQEAFKAIKGNQVSPGTELTGVTRLQYDKYKVILERHVKQNWSLPEWLRKKDLRAVINVNIDETGRILRLTLVKSSGQPLFDEIARDTVQNAAPLPAPPEKFVQKLKIDGVTFGFPE